MLKLVFLLSAVACALGATIPEGMQPQFDGRIVGGTTTTIASFPWQVSLQRSGSHFCGGSIYSNNIVITAAHCMQDASAAGIKIRAGSSYWNSGGVMLEISSFKNHEGYNSATKANDISVIRISSSLSYSNTIKSIDLALTAPVNGAVASVSGWGKTSFGSNSNPSQLQYINVNVIGRTQCASSTYGYGSSIKASMICAAVAGKDSCQGDVGGPMVSGGVLAGIVSWGNGCAEAGYPGVYADVAVLRTWIINNAETV